MVCCQGIVKGYMSKALNCLANCGWTGAGPRYDCCSIALCLTWCEREENRVGTDVGRELRSKHEQARLRRDAETYVATLRLVLR